MHRPRIERSVETYTAIAILVGLLGACGGSGSSPETAVPQAASEGTAIANVIQPLDDILASGPTFQDSGPNSVTLLLETTIPVACAAVYGKTTAYGQLATDTDMAGGGHRDHQPVMRGLEPDTEYHVVLQGVGADGTLYRSQDYMFRTAEAAAVPAESDAPEVDATAPDPSGKPTGLNFALRENGAQIGAVISNYAGGDDNSAYGANNAIDGGLDTEWSSDGDGDDAWIEILLAGETDVRSIGIQTRTMGTSAQLQTFQVVTERGKIYGPFDVPDASGVYYYSVAFTTETLRFEAVETSGGNTGLIEIGIYGDMEPEM